jgi:hypothetical protein
VLEKYMLTNREFRNVSENGKLVGFQLKVRVPYYRGVFLSMVKDFRITVDKEFFGPDKIKFKLGRTAYTLDELKNLPEVFWPFGSFATLIASKPGGLQPGLHTVNVKFLVGTSYTLPPEMDPEGLFRQGGPRKPGDPPDRELTLDERYEFTLSAPGPGNVTRKMTLVV